MPYLADSATVKPMTATKICAACNVEYPRNRSLGREQWKTSRFCCRQCAATQLRGVSLGPKPENRTGAEIPCDHCGGVFYAAQWQIRRRPGQQKFCSKACTYAGRDLKATFQVGHADLVPVSARGHTEETRKKISLVQRANPRRGPLNANWRGGKRKERQQAMGRWEYKEWRKAVFERDNYTCVACNERGGALQADHIKQWSKFPELRYDIDNGRTLCVDCHKLTPTWGHPKAQGVCHGR